MKKIVLVAAVCITAAVLVPVTSASALLTGSCKIAGEANFGGKKLPFAVPATLPFHFEAKEGNNFTGLETSGCVNEKGEPVNLEGPTTVDGKGELACVVSNGLLEIAPGSAVEGHGSITVQKETKEFKFDFVAAGGHVVFKVSPKGGSGVEGVGDAEFLTPGTEKHKEKLAKECTEGTLESLTFAAVAAGKF